MASKRELIEEEDSSWNEFNGLIESVDPSRMEEPGYSDEWSVKDLIGHVGGWLSEAGVVLEQIRMGTYADRDLDVDAMNRELYEANRDLPPSVVRAECFSARNRMLHELEMLPEVTPKAEEWFRESGARHYAEHLGRLRDWVSELSPRPAGL